MYERTSLLKPPKDKNGYRPNGLGSRFSIFILLKLKRIIFYIIGRTKSIFQYFPNIRFTKQHFARKLNKRENAITPIILQSPTADFENRTKFFACQIPFTLKHGLIILQCIFYIR